MGTAGGHPGKTALRKAMAALRDAVPPDERRSRSEAACRHAAEWLASSGVECFLAYASFRSELDTSPLLAWGWRRGAAVLLPACRPADRSMALYRVRSRAELSPGAYGLLEPDPARAEPWHDYAAIGAVFVPGLAFAPDGGRLGYGGGYYDRFAERMRGAGNAETPAYWMGLCFEAQLIAEVPSEPHDAKIDGVVTEQGVVMLR